MGVTLSRVRVASRQPLLALLVALAACAPRVGTAPPLVSAPATSAAPTVPPAPTPPPPTRAADLPIAVATAGDLPGADVALAAFRKSCASLASRDDRSGLTQRDDWLAPCAAAATASDAAAFFADNFTAVTVAGSGERAGESGGGFVTGYYEPEIAGSRDPAPGFAVPLYRRPPDLIEADLGAFAADLKGRKLRGRLDGNRLVPYPDRGAIMAGALAGRGLELAWAADPYEAFFLEIQGSGRLRLPDGRLMRIGYDSQNGRPYVAIGRVLIDRGELPPGGANMDSILAWLRSHPAEAPALLAANPSVVFFRELTKTRPDEGPNGALGVALTPGTSVAADPAFVPLGAPLLVTTTLPGGVALRALMVAQDTGGA
ncbi:MltA, partial [alpha proteobacterium AAP81b]